MAASQTKVYPLANRGLVQKIDPSSLQDGQFQNVTNVMSLQEGSVCSEYGTKLLGQLPSGANSPHPIRKLTIGGDDTANLRYVGETADIYRSSNYGTGSFTKVNAAGVLDSLNADHQEWKWGMQDYKAGSSGDPYAYFATPKFMLRDYGRSPYSALRQWGILPPARPAWTAVQTARSVNIGPASGVSPSLPLGASYVAIESAALDLSFLPGTPNWPSGSQATGYSNDDYIQITYTVADSSAVPDLTQLSTLTLQLSVHDTTFTSYYEGAIQVVPTGTSTAQGSLTNTVKISKSSFLGFGGAGAVGVDTYNWHDVQAVRLYVVASVASVVTLTLAANGVTFVGGAGPNTGANNAGPYDYRFCFRNATTGEFSNPSLEIPSWAYVYCERQPVKVTVYGTGDPNIATTGNTIAIYRRGGIFTDGYYRLIGYVANPGLASSVPGSVDFMDIYSDADIQNADTMELDNDPPVPSNLPTPISVSLASGYSLGWQTINVGVAGLTAGTTVHILSMVSSDYNEDCIVFSASGTSVTLFFNYAHVAGDKLTADNVCGQPAHLVMQTGDCLLVAGDVNNPHFCYQSKSGRPASFPVQDFESGAVKITTVGTPSDSIVNFCEINSEVVFLNKAGIYVSVLYTGTLTNAVRSQSLRGLWATWAWAKGDNEIWFVAYDGIYTWAGGAAIKRTESIDHMFRGKTVNGISPIDMTKKAALIGSFRNSTFHLLYIAQDGNHYELIYEALYDRWRISDKQLASAGSVPSTLFVEPDTGRMILGKYDVTGGRLSECELEGADSSGDYAAYDWTGSVGSPTGGVAIPFNFKTADYNLGDPFLLKLFQALTINVQNPDAALTVKCYYNGSTTADTVDQFTIPTSATLRPVPLPLQRLDTSLSTYGKQARTIALEFTSTGGVRRTKITHVALDFVPLADMQAGKAYDWDFHGWEHDKRFIILKLEYDNRDDSGTAHDITLVADTRGGPYGVTTTLAAASWTLPATTAGRNRVSLPFPKDIVGKLIRLRPLLTPNQAQPAYNTFTVLDFSYEFEKYPPDVISNTEYRDAGSPYDKYWQQLLLDVNTNGQNVTVSVDVDGTVLGTTYVVNTTISTRNVNLTLPPQTKGKKARAIVDVAHMSTTAMFQLFNHDWICLPADKGPVQADYDYDDLGWPHDKKLQRVTIWYEQGTPSASAIIQMDVIEGIGGTTDTANKQQFTLTGTGRAQQSFIITDGTIVKAVRLFPINNDKNFRMWKYQFDKIEYPPDIAGPSEWDDLGWVCEKILRGMDIDVDTGNVAASMQAQADGANIGSAMTITTTSADRNRHFSFASDLIGRRFRLVPAPGTGGKFQQFRLQWDVVREPCPMTAWDSYEQTFGTIGWKFVKQIWIEYICSAAITLKIYRDGNVLFTTITLPAHTTRSVEKILLGAKDATTSQLNKSKTYRLTATVTSASTPFKFYPDSTWIEWKPVNGDQRAGYARFNLFENLAGPGKF